MLCITRACNGRRRRFAAIGADALEIGVFITGVQRDAGARESREIEHALAAIDIGLAVRPLRHLKIDRKLRLAGERLIDIPDLALRANLSLYLRFDEAFDVSTVGFGQLVEVGFERAPQDVAALCQLLDLAGDQPYIAHDSRICHQFSVVRRVFAPDRPQYQPLGLEDGNTSAPERLLRTIFQQRHGAGSLALAPDWAPLKKREGEPASRLPLLSPLGPAGSTECRRTSFDPPCYSAAASVAGSTDT